MSDTQSIADKKRWLHAFLKELKSRPGNAGFSDRHLARRAGLHPQEVHRWLYGDHLPSASSVYEFTSLLHALGASDTEQQMTLAHLDLNNVWNREIAEWYRTAGALVPDDAELLFVIKSARSGRHWNIASWIDPLHYRVVIEAGEHRYCDPALSSDGQLLVGIEGYPSAERRLELWHRHGQRYAFYKRLSLHDAARGAWSPTSRAVCCDVAVGDTGKERAIFSYDVTTNEEQQLTSGAFFDVWPTWSPDAAYVAFQRGAELWAVDPGNGREWCLLPQSRTDANQVWAPAISPDGRYLAYVQGINTFTDEVRSLHLASGTITTLVSNQGTRCLDPCWLPGGEQLLCASTIDAGDRSELWLVDADGTNLQQVTRFNGTIYRPTWGRRVRVT